MWDITRKFSGRLPEGFHLVEEAHFLRLFYGEEEAAVFSTVGATPESIEQAAEKHLRKVEAERR